MGHHKDISKLPPDGEKFDITKIAKLNLTMFWIGLLALAGCAIAFLIPATRPSMSYSWLFAFVFFFTIALGGVFWTLLHHATNSGWGVAVRRMMENVGRMFPWLAVFILPLLVPDVRESLWEWMGDRQKMIEEATEYADHHFDEYAADWQKKVDGAEAALAEVEAKVEAGMANASPGEKAFLQDKLAYEQGKVEELKAEEPTMHSVEHHNMVEHYALLVHKSGYLNIGFWFIRLILYFGLLTMVIRLLRGWSIKQDVDGDWKYTRLARKASCGFIPIFGVALTFAVIDWLMCLDYTWFSTMWGVYIFAGTAGASMAVIILVVTFVRSQGYLQEVVSDEHYHAMGKLMFAFVVFWGYIAFSQYFLYWYANITEETRFYILRNTGGWWYMSLILVVGHFFIPFLLLLRRAVKKSPRLLCAFAVWVLVMHMIDMYWIVIPERGPSLGESLLIPGAFLLDALAFIGMGSMLTYLFLRQLGSDSLYPCRALVLKNPSTWSTNVLNLKTMPTSPEDTPLNRFVTFWWALAVFVSFGVLTVLAAGSRSCRSDEGGGYNAQVVAEREAKLEVVMKAQAQALEESAMPLDEAMAATVKELAKSEAAATKLPVPGTQAAVDAMQKAAAAAPVKKAVAPIAPVDDPIDEATLAAIMKEGEKAYITCSACHGPDGQGMQIGPQKMAPSLTGSEITLGDPDRLALVVLKGIFREPTSPYVGIMAPLESAYDDEQLASVLTYVRKSFGNSALTVTAEAVAAAREKFATVSAPGGIKREEIDKIAAGSSSSNP